VSADLDAGWQDRSILLPTHGSACRLRLQSSPAAAELGLAAWAVPQLLLPDSEPRGPNLILISLDTLRSDHLSGYGYPRETSPTIDSSLIAKGTSFARVSSTHPITHISHVSIFSGLYPAAQPGIRRVPNDSSIRMLAEALRDAGFLTSAWTEDGWVSASSGFARGFQRFIEYAFMDQGRGEQIFAAGKAFVREHRAERFFLFLHTYKTHSPYWSSPGYQSLFADDGLWADGTLDPFVTLDHQSVVDDYDRAIRELDDRLGSFLSELDELELSSNTHVVIVSDHGEAFGEHGAYLHGFAGNEEQLAVPLVIRGPGVAAGRRVESPVSIVDVAPTLLDLLELPALSNVQGRSLRASLTSATHLEPEPMPVYFAWRRQGASGVRVGDWKLVSERGKPELFDLAADPHERAPILEGPRFEATKQVLDEYLAHSREMKSLRATQPRTDRPSLMPVEVRDSLRALGYIE
jgi:arylsulfatase A-like enzyme